MSKCCVTYTPCVMENTCALRAIPEHLANGFFFPPRVGENCDAYMPLTEASWGEGKDSVEND